MSGHEHTKRCYWDFLEARWVCRPELDEPRLVSTVPTAERMSDEPVGTAVES